MSQFNDPNTIDWKTLWQKLDWDDESHREEATRKRLQRRARQYASLPPEKDDETAGKRFVLTFSLGKERYAIDVQLVRIVRSLDTLFPVPGTPSFYPGVVNIRGQIVTVMDLRLFFDMRVEDSDAARELIVVEANNLQIGLLAHHVYDVISVPSVEVEAIDDIRYAYGVTADRLVLLDIARMFEDSRLVIGGVDE
jgi:purine-binding chemotaxis protein CheW